MKKLIKLKELRKCWRHRLVIVLFILLIFVVGFVSWIILNNSYNYYTDIGIIWRLLFYVFVFAWLLNIIYYELILYVVYWTSWEYSLIRFSYDFFKNVYLGYIEFKKQKGAEFTNKTTKKIVYNDLIENNGEYIETFTDEEFCFMNKFSWWWFLAPSVMLMFANKYNRALWSFASSLFWIIKLIVRFVVANNARKWMYMYQDYDSFEEYVEETKKAEKFSIIVFFSVMVFALLSLFLSFLPY